MKKICWCLCLMLLISACHNSDSKLSNVNWDTYLGDPGRQHYSPLVQIDRDNVANLEEVWRYRSGESTSLMYTSPLIVNGVLYGLSPSLDVFALNAASGKELWRNELGLSGRAQRGLMWWQDGEDRRILFTAGSQLIAINADSGRLVASFGDEGKLDLTPSIEGRGGIDVTVPGVIYQDKVILGFSTSENSLAFPGTVRAFNIIDGSLEWTFHSIPLPGQPGSETWAEGALEIAGGANVWTGMALDEERGLLFAPTGSATPDFYGAKRLGDNLYANSLLALDARTGELRWHYQVVKHDLWDRDNPAPPTLVQVEIEGQIIDAVTLTTKSGHLYVFDRETGESLHPIISVETDLPSTLPGEVPAKTQRVSSIAFSRQSFEITQRTPEATAHVNQIISDWDLRPWAPPKVGTVLITPWYDGGAEWGGSAFDPENNRLILNANDASGILELTEVPVGCSNYGSYRVHCGACHGADLQGTDQGPSLVGLTERLTMAEIAKVVKEGKGRMPAFDGLDTPTYRGVLGYILSPEPKPDEPSKNVRYALGGYVYLKDQEGLPANAPPWGTLNSIDLASGKIVWSFPLGNFLSHPDLGYGAINYGGPVVTASGLIFIGATPDKKFRAVDSEDGRILWETELSAAAFSTPAIYSVEGRQFVVISAGGGRLGPPSGSDYFAFALPEAG